MRFWRKKIMGSMFGFAPKLTFIQPSSTDPVVVFTGGPIRVWGFVVSITDATVVNPTITIQTNEAVPTVLFVIGASVRHINYNIPFVADKGLQVVASIADVITITFYHSQEGS